MTRIRAEMQRLGSPGDFFHEYDQLNVLPHHLHKNKKAQRHAVFVLGKCLSRSLELNPGGNEALTRRFEALAVKHRPETAAGA